MALLFKILAVPLVPLALIALAATLGGFFGSQWWVLDVVANFRLQYAAVLAVAALVLALARWRLAASLAAAGLVLNMAVIAPAFLPRSAPPAEAADLRVLSFNVFAANERYEAVTDYIRRVDADVVFLHEAYQPWEEAVAAAELGYEVTPSRTEDLIFGTLVLARPGAEVRSFGFALEQPRAVEVRIAVGGTDFAVLGIHPVAPTTPGRAEQRDRQLAWAADWADQESGPVAVVGDFNATPWSSAYRRLREQGELSDSWRGFGVQPTYRTDSWLVRIPIDNLLHSEQVTTTRRRLGPALGSDHYPLLVDLAVGSGS